MENMMRNGLKALFVIAAVAMLAGYGRASAQCPAGPPGYWTVPPCKGGVTVHINGVPCLVEICYCFHASTGPGDNDAYHILTVRGQVPGCLPPVPDPALMDLMRRALVNVDHEVPGDQVLPCEGERQLITVTNSLCATNVGSGTNVIWQGCGGGECVTTYYFCMGSGVTQVVSKYSTGVCNGGPGCVQVCE
jgi:hypothetical protein